MPNDRISENTSLQDTNKLAAIDVGTNSFHLVIVKVLPNNSFSVLTKEKIVVRLGESPKQIKLLTEEAMERGVEAMTLFTLIAQRMNAPLKAIATSAVREASNGDEFIERVKTATGVRIEVVSGFEEARLIYVGVLQALPIFSERIALFDIGGGSTEILVGQEGKSLYANSFKIGAIRMTQRFFPDEEITKKQMERCRMFVRGELYFAAREVRGHQPTQMIASSGTAQTIGAMVIADRGEELPDSLNGVTVTLKEVRRLVKIIFKAKTFRSRAKIPGSDPRRADILAAGAIVLQTILEECGFEQFTLSNYALREGIIFESIRSLSGENPDPSPHLKDLRYETVMKIGRTYNFDEQHALQVAKLSLKLYDALSPLHELPSSSRELLEAAALLHDIGYYISHSAHHKHALYLIKNSEILGFSNEEILLIANIARYHRKSHPKSRHNDYAFLSRGDKQRVRILSGILRIADGLDRTHRNGVEDIGVAWNEDQITLSLSCTKNHEPTFELWSARRKKGLMEEVFARTVVLSSPSIPSAIENSTDQYTFFR